jgi:methionine biosynthesis protein MetW
VSKLQKKIASHITPHSKVLDLGCGTGCLLQQLSQDKQVQGYGIEINFDSIVSCVEKGLSVYHGNLDDGLTGFANQSYDTVILSQTIQQVKKPLYVMSEMLRVGKRAIITFPNFAHYSVRLSLIFGRIPQTKALPYHWYNTPNIRVSSINGFRELCRNEGYNILEEDNSTPKWISNLFSSEGFFIIEKRTPQ